MAHGIAARLARLVGKEGAGRAAARLALVLRVENAEMLRAGIGPALLERMLDRLLLRLVAELRLLPLPRSPGASEILGLFAAGCDRDLPDLPTRLRAICAQGVELPGLRICPQIRAVIVRDGSGRRDMAVLHAHARAALQGANPFSAAGQVRLVDLPPRSATPKPEPGPALFDRVELFFQPQLCCNTGRVLGLRVLPGIRMDDQGRCELSELVPRLDDEMLGRIVADALRQALACLGGWDRMGAGVPLLSLPLPDRVLADAAAADAILWELDRQDLSPARLEIELGEPVGRSGGRMPVMASLRRLTAAGCGVALGDFGAGSAGLDDLRRLGAGRVRIGPAFIAGCDRRVDQQRMILAILALAEHLHLKTLADGVGTREECSFLVQIGFDAVQGPAVAPPLEPGAVDDFLLDHVRSLPAPLDLHRGA